MKFLWGNQPPADTSVDQGAGGAGLLTPAEAQKLEVVRMPKFLTDSEITQLLEVAATIRRDGAGAIRLQSSDDATQPDGSLPSWDAQGYESNRGDWTTTYLHTARLFQNRLPDLHKKIVNAAIEADCERWGICNRAVSAANGLGIERAAIETRCVVI
eukprot:SAG31_NODE_3424_length_4291_cov_1.659113_8_plen_157_part_00